MSRRSSAVRSEILGDFSETDLNKLQLQYRRADATKRAYAQKIQGLINRDKQEMQRLQNEHEELVRNLGVSSTDTSVFQDLMDMLVCRDGVDEETKAEKGKVAFLKEQILRWERKLAAQRISGGATCCKSDNSSLLKKTCRVENKLSRGQKCFSELMMRNGHLREELKTLQMEKKQFSHVHSQMEKELHAIRRDISNLMTKCTEAFNASAKIQEKQRLLTDQNAKDVAQYVKERSNLELEMAHYCNFGAFLHTKASARINQDIHYRKDVKQLASVEWELEDFEHAINKILRKTKESDLDKLVKNYIQMEGQNYTLLNFVNNQHNEAEAIQRQISQLSNEMESFVIVKQKRQEQLQALELSISFKQEASEQQLAFYQRRAELLEKLLDQLRAGVESLLQVTCDSSVICEQLGFSDRVQTENIAEYLGIVEDRVNELLTLQSYLHFQEDQSQWDTDSLSTIAEHLLGIKPPSVNLTTAAVNPAPDDPDSLDLMLLKDPVSREDLLALFIERIQRKQNRQI